MTAKQYGDSVEFDVAAGDPKEALDKARQEARRIFGYEQGDAVAPAVSVKPIVEKESKK